MLVDVGADTTIKDQLQHSALDVTKSDKIRNILKSTDSSKQKRKAEAHKELLEYLKQADVYETEKLKEKHRLEELQRRQEFEEQQQADLLRLQEEQRLEQEEARTREQNLPQALNQLRQALGGLQRAMPHRSLFDEDGTVKKHQ